jgi:hypothetical protein
MCWKDKKKEDTMPVKMGEKGQIERTKKESWHLNRDRQERRHNDCEDRQKREKERIQSES